MLRISYIPTSGEFREPPASFAVSCSLTLNMDLVVQLARIICTTSGLTSAILAGALLPAGHDDYGRAFMVGYAGAKKSLRLFRRDGAELVDDGVFEVGRLRYD